MRTARNTRITVLCGLALIASPDLTHQALAAAMLADYAETLRAVTHFHHPNPRPVRISGTTGKAERRTL